MKKSVWRCSFLVLVLSLFTGCTSIYWDDDYIYKETRRDQERKQDLRIVSNPDADLAINNTYKDETPTTVQLPYSVDEVEFVKYKYKKKFLSEPVVIDKDRKIESVNNPRVYRFRFEEPGYNVLQTPVVIPYGRDTLRVEMEEGDVYWEEDKRFKGVSKNLERKQELTIESEPKALLSINGKKTARTPAKITLPYSVDEAKLVRKKFEESQGRGKKLLDEQESSKEFVKPTAHFLKFQAPGFYDLYLPITAPYRRNTISVALTKAGAIKKFDCMVEVEARPEYFPDIESVLDGYSKKKKLGTVYDEPQAVTNQPYEVQKYIVHTESALKFDQMVHDMRAMSREKQFVFDIVDADLNAKFSTNILEPGIQHVVTAKVRPHSEMFLLQNKRINHIGNTTTNTSYTFTVRLKPRERHVHAISRYKPENADQPLVVYQQIDVFEQEAKELGSTEELQKATGVSRAELEKHDLLKE